MSALLWLTVARAGLGELLAAHPEIEAFRIGFAVDADRCPAPPSGTWFEAAAPEAVRCVSDPPALRCWTVDAKQCAGLGGSVPPPAWAHTAASSPVSGASARRLPGAATADLRPTSAATAAERSWVRVRGRWVELPLAYPPFFQIAIDGGFDATPLVARPAVAVVTREGDDGASQGRGEVVLHVFAWEGGALVPLARHALGTWSWSRDALGSTMRWDVMKPILRGDALLLSPADPPTTRLVDGGTWERTARLPEVCRWSVGALACGVDRAAPRPR